MKIILVSSPSPYVNLLTRSAMLSNTEIVNTYDNVQEAVDHMNDFDDIDCVLATDRLYAGTVEDLVDDFTKFGKGELLYILLEKNDKKIVDFLKGERIPYTFESSIEPAMFLQDLESGKIHPGHESREETMQKANESLQDLHSKNDIKNAPSFRETFNKSHGMDIPERNVPDPQQQASSYREDREDIYNGRYGADRYPQDRYQDNRYQNYDSRDDRGNYQNYERYDSSSYDNRSSYNDRHDEYRDDRRNDQYNRQDRYEQSRDSRDRDADTRDSGSLPRWRAASMQEHEEEEERRSVQRTNSDRVSLDYTDRVDDRYGQPNLETRKNVQNDYQNPLNEAQMIKFKPITVCINSPKGGVGKTTLAIELASLIAVRAGEMDLNEIGRLSYNKKITVCLVDMNPSFDTMSATLSKVYQNANHATVTDWFQMIDQKIIDQLDETTRKELIHNGYQGIEQYLHTVPVDFTRKEVEKLTVFDEDTGLTILPSIAMPLDASYARPEYLDIILKTIKEYYDVVLIDTGNNISFFTLEAMRASDEVLLICTKSKGSAQTIMRLKDSIQDMRDPVDMSKFNLVINNPYGADSSYDSAEFSRVLQIPLVAEIPYEEKVRMAHEDGELFSINNKRSDFAKSCVRLAQSICPVWQVVPNRYSSSRKKKKRRGFFRR